MKPGAPGFVMGLYQVWSDLFWRFWACIIKKCHFVPFAMVVPTAPVKASLEDH